MSKEYNLSYIKVNNFSCFTRNNLSGITYVMNYGERLKIARKHAGLTQKELAEASGVSQANISKLEIGDATGSEYTVQLAIACDVRPEWLALESGEMTDGLYVENEKIKKAVLLMQELPEYALDEAINSLNSVAKLTQMASSTETAAAASTGTNNK